MPKVMTTHVSTEKDQDVVSSNKEGEPAISVAATKRKESIQSDQAASKEIKMMDTIIFVDGF